MKPNNLYHGNSYELIKKIPDKSIDCIYTDIPYQMTFNGGGNLSHKLKDYIKDEVESFSNGIDYSILEDFIRISKNINIFIWCSKEQILDIGNFFVKHGAHFNILTWTKTNPIPFGNAIWLSDIEYCLHFYKDAGFNVGVENKYKNYTSSLNIEDKKLYDHPTIKPLELVKRHLLNMTKENDIVFDPFIGSGTTAVAAKELGRRYLGFEIDKKYFEIASDRLHGIDNIDKREKENGILNIFDFLPSY